MSSVPHGTTLFLKMYWHVIPFGWYRVGHVQTCIGNKYRLGGTKYHATLRLISEIVPATTISDLYDCINVIAHDSDTQTHSTPIQTPTPAAVLPLLLLLVFLPLPTVFLHPTYHLPLQLVLLRWLLLLPLLWQQQQSWEVLISLLSTIATAATTAMRGTAFAAATLGLRTAIVAITTTSDFYDWINAISHYSYSQTHSTPTLTPTPAAALPLLLLVLLPFLTIYLHPDWYHHHSCHCHHLLLLLLPLLLQHSAYLYTWSPSKSPDPNVALRGR